MTTATIKIQFRVHDYSTENAAHPNGLGFYYDIPLDEAEDAAEPLHLDGPYPTRDEAIIAAQNFIVGALQSARTRVVNLIDVPIDLPVKRLTTTAIIPQYQTAGAAGMDLHADEDVLILAGRSKLVTCGIAIEIPAGYEGQVRPRSGLAYKYGITVLNSPGTIDSDYRGPVGVILHNTSAQDFHVARGDRIAQLVIAMVDRATPVEVSELSDTDRGAGGFGSTGSH